MSRPPKTSEGDFLSRWSQRKQDARQAPEEEPSEPSPAGSAPADAPERSEAEILEELGLPDPETLGPGSDFRAFMAEAVPDFIRRKALRRLWLSNPTLANLDMLVDYGEDYTNQATVVANLQSAYKAGRGYLDRLAGDKAPAEAGGDAPAAEAGERAQAGESAQAPATDDDPAEPRVGDAQSATADTAGDETAGEDTDRSEPDALPPEEARPAPATLVEAPPPRRRMRFEFDDG